ncbi:MAG: formylglycine-generating enzyme family protein, partial [Tannerella sp.]|nr:formylglycine-generating enzyme family protein [Tannerella sp.]
QPKRPEMITVKGGTFTMGCTSEQQDCDSDELPAHQVTVGDFRLSRTSITYPQYVEFLNAANVPPDARLNGHRMFIQGHSPVKYRDGKWYLSMDMPNRPMVHTTWWGAYEYCRWAGGRLPTEAEWEYAARGGAKSNGYRYAGGNNSDEVSWCSPESRGGVGDVARKKPNELGLYDMSGNVWEWCSDWYGDYPAGAQTNPTGPETGWNKVQRGGSGDAEAPYCRVSFRYASDPEVSMNYIGFRLLLPGK